jgi:tRNA wybutosine-synthesizing protein 3
MTQKKGFLENKENALQSLEKALNENKADEGMLPILKIINDSQEYYTSSSCAGRIVLLEIPSIGDKQKAKFLGRWHRTIEPHELISAAKRSDRGMIWLLAQSPIIHIAAKTNTAADKMVKIANASGFKNSRLKSVGKKPVVEVCSTERLDAPIGRDGILFCNEEHLKLLTEIANEIMEKSTIKLHRFEQNLKKYLSTHKTTKHMR